MVPPVVGEDPSSGFAPAPGTFLRRRRNFFPSAVRRLVGGSLTRATSPAKSSPQCPHWPQVRGDAGVARLGVLTARDQLDVDVQDAHRLVAADVGGVGARGKRRARASHSWARHLPPASVVQIPVGDQMGPDLTSRVVQRLVERVPGGVVPDGQRVQRDACSTAASKTVRWCSVRSSSTARRTAPASSRASATWSGGAPSTSGSRSQSSPPARRGAAARSDVRPCGRPRAPRSGRPRS